MLPESAAGQTLYIESRDARNRWRSLRLRTLKGDADAFKALELSELALEAEFAQFREHVDFLEMQGMLDAESLQAAANAIAWGQRLVDRLKASGVAA